MNLSFHNDINLYSMKNRKCIILSRVSTLQQDLTQQTDVVKQEAIRFGYRPENLIIIEDKESAVELSEEERNGLNTLKYYIENDKSVDCVMVYEISRISRQPKIVYSIRDYLVERKIQLIIMNPYCKVLKDDFTLSETANILFGIFASMAENEGYIRKMRFKRGREKKKADKKYFGHGILMGYDVDENDNYILHPTKSKIVQSIFERYVNENVSMKKLAKQLYEEGILGDIVHETYYYHVVNILKNTAYIGESFYPPLVSKDLFYAARNKAGRNTKWSKMSRKDTTHVLLKGVLHNEINDFTLTFVECENQYKSQNFRGESISIHKNVIEPLVWSWVVELHKKFNSGNKDKRLQVLRNDRDRLYAKLNNTSEKITKLREKLDKIEERWINDKISTEKRDSLRSVVENELNSLTEQKRKFESDLSTRQSQINKQRTTKLDYDNQTPRERRSLVLEVIRKITLKNISTTHNKYKKIIKVYNNYDDSVDIYLCDIGKFIRSKDPFRTITKI